MWYIIVGCVITLIITILLVVADFKARKTNPDTPDMPAILAIGLVGCIVAWPLIFLAALPLLYEIVEDLIDDYKFRKKYGNY